MSGGHFDYDQYRINDIVDKIEEIVRTNSEVEYYNYSEKTIEEFNKAIYFLKIAGVYAQRIDWLVSADDSESTFHERLKEELTAITN